MSLVMSVSTTAMAAKNNNTAGKKSNTPVIKTTVETPVVEEPVAEEEPIVETPVEEEPVVEIPEEEVPAEEEDMVGASLWEVPAEEADFGIMTLEEGEEEVILPSIKLPVSVQAGKAITVTAENYPEGSELSYRWTVAGKQVSTEPTYTPTTADEQKWIQVTVSCTGFADLTEKFYFSNLPVVYLDFDLAAVKADKSTYQPGSMKMQGNAQYSKDSYLYTGATEVKGRGNTSWSQSKKPFKLKLDSKANIFNMGKNKHWVLLANATEGSLMRNEMAYKLSAAWGMTYQDGTWVDLVINGNYYGNYYLCEHIRIGTGRVEVADIMDEADAAADAIYAAGVIPGAVKKDMEAYMEEHLDWISSDSVTYLGVTVKVSDYYSYDKQALISGGYLLELDGYFDEVSKFRSSLNQPIMFNSPEFVNTNAAMETYMQNFINSFERAIQQADFHTTYNGKKVSAYDLFDLDNLYKYWLVEEIFMNVDGMKKSTYMYKDRDPKEGISKMNMGPVWDMDWSSNGMGGSDPAVWQTVKYNDSAQAKQWYKYICKDPYFVSCARNYYWEHHNEIVDMVNAMYGDVETSVFTDNMHDYLYNSAIANEKLWGLHKTGFEGETQKLNTWMNKRIAWLDQKMASLDSVINSMGLYTPNTSVGMQLSGGKLTVTANGSKAEVMVNGKIIDTVALNKNTATVDISAALTDQADVIYTVIYSSTGSVSATNYKLDQIPPRGELTSINIATKPRTLVYEQGSDLDLTGMVVNGIYSNGSSTTIVNDNLEISGYDKNTVGTQTVTVSYAGKTASFQVNVVPAGSANGNWSNQYVTVYSDADPSGSKKMNLSVWEHTKSQLYRNSVGVNYSGNFTDVNFYFVTAPGWEVKEVKYNDAAGDRNDYIKTMNATSGSFNFKGCPLQDKSTGNTLIIDLVRITEPTEPSYTTLEQSFTATDCGILTQEIKQTGTDNSVGFIVNKDGQRAFASAKKFTYMGEFNELRFNYVAPEGYECTSVSAQLSDGTTEAGNFENGIISFAGFTGDSSAVANIVIDLKKVIENDYTLTIEKDTVKYNLNAVVYLTINREITASDIKLFENGAAKEFSYVPECTANGDGSYTWKLYIKPGTVAIHTYTISVDGVEKVIKIRGSKTIYS